MGPWVRQKVVGESRTECPRNIDTKARELNGKVNGWALGMSEAIQDVGRDKECFVKTLGQELKF